MKVIALKPAGSDRVTVSLDNGEEIRSTAGIVTDFRLYLDFEADSRYFEGFRRASVNALVFETSVELLSRRRMSVKELTDKLQKKGADDESIAWSITKLNEYHLLDDASYSEAVARHYSSKGYGAGRVKAELSKRGISRELWQDALDVSSAGNDDKLDRLIGSRLKDPQDRDQVRKITAFLFRRGYSWDEIRRALGRYTDISEDY